MKITFTNHAWFKFKIFEKHGFKITEEHIKDIVSNPSSTSYGKKGRLIIKGQFDYSHVVRVICEVEGDELRVITFYPARKDRYEN